jgi:hypothetical protein
MKNFLGDLKIKSSHRFLIGAESKDKAERLKEFLKKYYPENYIATTSKLSVLPTGEGFDVIILLCSGFLKFGKDFEDFQQFISNLSTRRTQYCPGIFFINQC